MMDNTGITSFVHNFEAAVASSLIYNDLSSLLTSVAFPSSCRAGPRLTFKGHWMVSDS